MNIKLLLIAVIILGIFILFYTFSFFSSDENKIRNIIYEAKDATEKENIAKCIAFLSNTYQDKDGNNKAMLFRIIRHVFEVYRDIIVEIKLCEVDFEDQSSARANIVCFGQGKRKPRKKMTYSLDMQNVEFEAIFQKEGNAWKVIELRFIEPENFMQLLKGL